jgi:hypothetical protein
MLKSILHIAEALGHRLAHTTWPTSGSVSPAPVQVPVQGGNKAYVTFEIKPYKENELGYTHWQGFLANFSSISTPMYFSVRGNRSSVAMYIHVPAQYAGYVENVFYASFPTTEITEQDMAFDIWTQGYQHFKFTPDCSYYDTSEFSKGGTYVDPFKDILTSFQAVPDEGQMTILYENVFDFKDSFWKKMKQTLKKLGGLLIGQWWGKSDAELKDDKHAAEIKKVERDVQFAIRLKIEGLTKHMHDRISHDVVHVYDKLIYEGAISLVKTSQPTYANMSQFINFFHIPTKAYLNNSLHYTEYRKLPAPMTLPNVANSEKNSVTLLGTTDYKGKPQKFGIRKEDKFRHIYIVGKTGTGKSTFISNMVRSDMLTNQGIAVVDPHGDLVEDVMAHIPSRRTNDVVIFDVSDTQYPVGFNVLEYEREEEKNLVASGVVSIFKKLYGNSWGPRLEYILRNVMLSILEYPNASLLHVARMLTDKNFREDVLRNVTDPIVLKFWRSEYDKWNDNQRNEAVGPITNKIGQFLSSSIVRNIFAQPKSKINIRKIMDEGKILLINLSKGKIGEDSAAMIGSFLVTKFQIDAMSRADIDFKDRRDFYLYIDEFQNFATDSFESILSEARKYRLSLIVANQYTSQIAENVRNAIFGNVGTIVSFGLWYDDATMMSSQFKDLITPNDLLSLPKFTAYAKLMVDGVTSDPFSMKTFPLPKPDLSDEIKEKMRAQSRQRYTMEKEKLEKLLKVRSEKQFTEAEKIAEKSQVESVKDDGTTYSVSDLKIGETYEGYVKLKYNYGIFVTYKWVEGLLHKSEIAMPPHITEEQWKDLHQIGDKIRVTVKGFKEIEGVKRVVWTQK